MDLMSSYNEISTKAKILLLFANAYEMTDDNGRYMSGCTVHYLFWGEYGERMATQSVWDLSKPVGLQRAKCSLDKSLREKIPVAPAIYEGDFYMAVGGDGKPVMKLRDVAYVCNVECKEKVIPGMQIPGMVVPAELETAGKDSKTNK